jgi:hypothetical protein
MPGGGHQDRASPLKVDVRVDEPAGAWDVGPPNPFERTPESGRVLVVDTEPARALGGVGGGCFIRFLATEAMADLVNENPELVLLGEIVERAGDADGVVLMEDVRVRTPVFRVVTVGGITVSHSQRAHIQ